MKNITPLLFALILIVLTSGCKKTLEGETNNWERNTREVKSLSTRYPGFAVPLNSVLREASSIMDQAHSISGEEAQIEKMAQANGMLSGGWVRELGKMEDYKNKLRSKVTDIGNATLDDGDQIAAEFVVKSADRAIEAVDRGLLSGANDAESAAMLLTTLREHFDQATKDLDQVLTNASKKEREAQQKEEEEKQAKANWKCEFCDKMNPHDAKECGGCGAGRK